MTGMGRDGSAGLGKIYERGGMTVGQDEASSVVYGMPKVAYELGYVRRQVPLYEIAGTIAEVVRSAYA
jgi:two-component system chemotaxis response regulator CheB